MSSGRNRLPLFFGRPKRPLLPSLLIKKWKIVRGDQVVILAGKNKGEVGRVRRVIRKRNSVILIDKNLAIKNVPPSESTPTGRIMKEMPIHYSNVALVNPLTQEKCKVEFKKVTREDGKSETRRFVRNTDIEIPKTKYLEYQDQWIDGERDTAPEEVRKVTFSPIALEKEGLSIPPLPARVIDEIRFKYSKYRRN